MTPETRLKNKCREWIAHEFKHYECVKLSDRYTKGILDSYLVVAGCTFFYELKAPGVKPDFKGLQALRIKNINANGAPNILAFWSNDFEHFKQIITNTIKWHGGMTL